MISIFEIIGPIMIGPSSSHTAGANKLARVSTAIYGRTPDKVTFNLYGSFAKTYIGHGTDKALASGVIGFKEDDTRIRDALTLAEESGIEVVFKPHLNKESSRYDVETVFEKAGYPPFSVMGRSVGGGRIVITEVDGISTCIQAGRPTLVLEHADENGVISKVTGILAYADINIASMRTDREAVGKRAMSVLEMDSIVDETALTMLRNLKEVENIVAIW